MQKGLKYFVVRKMKKFKEKIHKILFLPIFIILFFSSLCAVGLTFIFISVFDLGVYTLVSYVLLIYLLLAFILLVGLKAKGNFKKAGENHKKDSFLKRVLTDTSFRTKTALYFSSGMNLFYGAINVFLGLSSNSLWFYILSGYYIILSIIRFTLLKVFIKQKIGENLFLENKKAITCGKILLALNITLIAALLMMIFKNKGYEYKGYIIIIMGFYTVYIIVLSVINIFKYRTHKSPIILSSRVVSLSAALVSLLALESTLIFRFFSKTTRFLRNITLSLTGGAVIFVVIVMSIYLIVQSKAKLKNLKGKEKL